MAIDLTFDVSTRDMPLTTSGDFVINEEPSVQNGRIMLSGRVFNLQKPQFGVGFNSQVQGGDVGGATFQLNRCVAQISADGGKANWKRLPPTPNVQFDFEMQVNYNQ